MFINREIAQLLIFQRNELTNPTLQKIRKIFGRRFFTKFVSKYLISPKLIGNEYLSIMKGEYETISKFLDFDKNPLQVGRIQMDNPFYVLVNKALTKKEHL